MGSKNSKMIFYVFIFLQILLYASFLSLDMLGIGLALSKFIKFMIIILCFCFALLFARGADKGILFCMKAALLFTVVSDYFLLIKDIYLYGVITFIIVQQLYGVRLILAKLQVLEYSVTNKEKIAFGSKGGKYELLLKLYLVRLGAQALITGLLITVFHYLRVAPNSLLCVSIFYFVSILNNTISASLFIKNSFKVKGDILFAVGMIFFLLCDINVGIFNMSSFINLPESVYHILYTASSILMWTFYAPAQVLISLSSTKMTRTI